MLKWKSNLSLENVVYVAVKEEKKAIKDHLLKQRCKDKKGKKSPEHIRLKKQYKDMKGFDRAYNEFKHLVNPISWKFKDRNPG
nr:hypothetical protein [Tanacetum cinerariifolium]